MAYKALYRTYRPRDFDEVAGQEHITRTFKNALKHRRLSHAYLFSGPRGTGKTSVAKIIAKGVNCENGPAANPCNTCDICRGIDSNTINDVIEIDAASNNGVDEIRELRDKVKYLPGVGQYKVYIIDEVHMLSIGAFNALLKTLEEPPKHVLFILATTEPHKIPSTIHSRCQRFDFRGIGKAEIESRLGEIIEKEAIDIRDDAISLIAESVEGGMRDAISLLDQALAYAEGTIDSEAVHAIRGSVGHERILEIAQAIHAEDAVRSLNALDRLLEDGKEPTRVIEDATAFYRDLLLLKNAGEDSDKTLHGNEKAQNLAESLSNPLLYHYIDILSESRQRMRFTSQGRLHLELAFVKMVDRGLKQDVRAQENLEKLESKVHNLQEKLETIESRTREAPLDQPATDSDEHRAQDVTPADALFDRFESESESEVSDDQTEKHREDPSDEKRDEPGEETPTAQTESAEETDSAPSEQPNKYQKLYERFSQKKYSTFDIRYVEDVLNTGDRQERIDMTKRWYDLERFVDDDRMQYAKMVTEGNLVATNGVMLIVTYENTVTCNRLMKPQIKGEIIEVLEAYFERPIMFMALPERDWKKIQTEFLKKFRKQEDKEFIRLSKIENDRLVEIPDNEDTYDDVEDDSVKEAKDIFGEEVVKVKKGE